MQSVDNPAIIKLYSIRCLLQVNIVAVFQNSQGSCDLWDVFVNKKVLQKGSKKESTFNTQ